MLACTLHPRGTTAPSCPLQERALKSWIEASERGDQAVAVLVDPSEPRHVALCCQDEMIAAMIDGALLSQLRGLAVVARHPEWETCALPPEGFSCDLERGHEGQCATHPTWGGLGAP
jgi:hypothetical protein